MNQGDTQAGMQVRVEDVALRGVVSVVPATVKSNQDFLGQFDQNLISEITKMTGVESRRISDPDQTTADIAYVAAQHLLTQLKWDVDSVDALIFVSQTPDYRLPATACLLQERLGLKIQCAAFDVNLGCSGYVYGLWLASRLIDGVSVKRVLLVAGDTSSKLTNPEDRSTALLFGDAATATGLEFEKGTALHFMSSGRMAKVPVISWCRVARIASINKRMRVYRIQIQIVCLWMAQRCSTLR
jgi:3-oxoacyl-[acyl-carrier-protein] synthase-3